MLRDLAQSFPHLDTEFVINEDDVLTGRDTSIYIQIRAHTYIYIYIHLHLYRKYVHVYLIFIYMNCVCMYVCVYIYIYICTHKLEHIGLHWILLRQSQRYVFS